MPSLTVVTWGTLGSLQQPLRTQTTPSLRPGPPLFPRTTSARPSPFNRFGFFFFSSFFFSGKFKISGNNRVGLQTWAALADSSAFRRLSRTFFFFGRPSKRESGLLPVRNSLFSSIPSVSPFSHQHQPASTRNPKPPRHGVGIGVLGSSIGQPAPPSLP